MVYYNFWRAVHIRSAEQQQKNKQLVETVNEQEKQLIKKDKELQQQHEDNQQYLKKLFNANAENHNQQQLIENLSLTLQFQEKNRQCEDLTNQLLSIKKENNSLHEQLNNFISEKEDLIRQIDTLKLKEEKSQNENTQLNKSIESFKNCDLVIKDNEIEQFKKTLETKNDELKNLQDQLNQSNELIKVLKEKQQEAQHELPIKDQEALSSKEMQPETNNDNVSIFEPLQSKELTKAQLLQVITMYHKYIELLQKQMKDSNDKNQNLSIGFLGDQFISDTTTMLQNLQEQIDYFPSTANIYFQQMKQYLIVTHQTFSTLHYKDIFYEGILRRIYESVSDITEIKSQGVQIKKSDQVTPEDLRILLTQKIIDIRSEMHDKISFQKPNDQKFYKEILNKIQHLVSDITEAKASVIQIHENTKQITTDKFNPTLEKKIIDIWSEIESKIPKQIKHITFNEFDQQYLEKYKHLRMQINKVYEAMNTNPFRNKKLCDKEIEVSLLSIECDICFMTYMFHQFNTQRNLIQWLSQYIESLQSNQNFDKNTNNIAQQFHNYIEKTKEHEVKYQEEIKKKIEEILKVKYQIIREDKSIQTDNNSYKNNNNINNFHQIEQYDLATQTDNSTEEFTHNTKINKTKNQNNLNHINNSKIPLYKNRYFVILFGLLLVSATCNIYYYCFIA
jgi:hypothetical protein